MVDLLQELTDVDSLQENEEGADILLDALVWDLLRIPDIHGGKFQ